MSVDYERRGRIAVITIDRAEVRNAIDRATASALADAWRTFDTDSRVDVGILHGAGGHFSAGADLKAFDLVDTPGGFLGFTRTEVSKPTIAAVDGFCVAGGLEMALWCDLRIAGADAVFGCLERRFGVPLTDGGTVRLPHVVGLGVALELILTGRQVTADEAHVIGLVNAVTPAGGALDAAVQMAMHIASFPQGTVRTDRASVLASLGVDFREALEVERDLGASVMDVAAFGADRFAAGAGRSGADVPPLEPSAATERAPIAWQSVAPDTDRPADEAPPAETGDGEEDAAPDEEVPAPPAQLVVAPEDPALRVPASGHGRPLIVVAGEADGAWARPVLDALGQLGFVTYAVEVSGTMEDDARRLEDAVNSVFASPAVLGDRVGIVAIGSGAPVALHVSTVDSRVSAVVEFSGHQPSASPSFRLATASYLGHHGSADEGPDRISPFRMESTLRDLGIDATFHSYRGAEADFFVPGSPGHHPTFTDVAWQRTKLFLQRAV